MTIQVGRPAGRRRADAGRDQPVDPVRAPVAEEPSPRMRPTGRTPPGRGSASRTPCRRAPRPRYRRAERAWTPARLALRRRRARPRSPRGPRGPPRATPRATPGPPRRGGSASPGRASAPRRARSSRRWLEGSFQPNVGSTTTWRSAGNRGEPPRSALLVGMSPNRTTSSGSSAERPSAGDRVVGPDDSSRSCDRGEAARLAPRGSDSRRRAARAATGHGELRVELAAGRRSGPGRAADPLGELVEQRVVGERRSEATAVSGRSPRPSSASGEVAVTSSRRGSGPSGSRQATFRCTGPGRGSPRAAA